MKRVELWINNTLVDLNEDGVSSLFLMNYNIADIREPDKRQTDFSKTITVPGSKANDKLFSFAFDLHYDIQSSGTVNFNPDFNPNLKAEAVAYLDGVQFFKGIAQLDTVRIVENRWVQYDIVLFGKLANIFTDIGERELRDIDFSEYDHTYSVQNTAGSWDSFVVQNGSQIPFAWGTGYYYPLIDYGYSTDLQNFSQNNLYPAIYVKEYVDKIFSEAGYTYTSTFLTSDFFKHLIIPFSSDALKLTASQILDRKFRAEVTSSSGVVFDGSPTGAGNANPISSAVRFNDDTTPPNFDTTGQYNTSNGVFTANATGVHTFTAAVGFNLDLYPDTADPVTFVKQVYVYLELHRQTVGQVGTTILGSTSMIIHHTSSFTGSYSTATNASILDPDYISNFNPHNFLYLTVPNVTLSSGDKVSVRYRTYYANDNNQAQPSPAPLSTEKFKDAGGTYYDGTIILNILATSEVYNEVQSQIVEGQTVTMNNCVPDKVKQKDFMLSLIKMFNLYIEQDPDIDNNLLIEPRNTYYNNTVLDWTYKRDISRELTIKPMGALDARRYLFRYKNDTDYYNTDYNSKHPLTYGEREKVINNDFIKSTKTIELIFSPTPSVGSQSNDRVIPRIIKITDNGVITPHQGNIRILYAGGRKSSNQVWNINSSGQVYPFSEYPYAGHLDDPYNSTYDLNWFPPEDIYWFNYYQPIWYTDNNLYNAYWKQFIEEVTDPNSKIVTGWFRLDAADVKNIDFRKLYYFDEQFFRLNRVKDYNPVSEGLTECEFIKVKAAVPFSPSSGRVTDGGELIADEVLIGFSNPTYPNQNNTAEEVLISGSNIRANDTVRSSIVAGDGVVIGDYNTRNAVMSSSGVFVQSGLDNVTIFNSTNKRFKESDSFYVFNQAVFGKGGTENINASKARDSQDLASVHLCDATNGSITITMEHPVNWNGLFRYFKKVDSTGNTVILNCSGFTIDGSSSKTLTTQYESVTLYSDGSNIHIVD